ncbi:hypothetical protein P9112_008778 [Eukaryota sp. TZLM1-RC]
MASAVFGIFYLMIQNNSSLKKITFFAFLLAFSQFWTFTFETDLYADIPGANSLISLLNFLQPNLGPTDPSSRFQFFLFTSVGILIVCIVLYLSVRTAISFNKGIFTSLLSVRLLRLLGLALLSVLFIPNLQLLLGPLHCSNVNGKFIIDSLTTPTDCYTFPNILYQVFAFTSVMILVPFAAFLSLVYFNSDYTSTDLLSRSHGRFDLVYQLSKVTVVFATTFISSNFTKFFVISFISFLLLYYYLFYLPYHKTFTSFMCSFMYSSIWTSSLFTLFLTMGEVSDGGFKFDFELLGSFELGFPQLSFSFFFLVAVINVLSAIIVIKKLFFVGKYLDGPRLVKLVQSVKISEPQTYLSVACHPDPFMSSTTTQNLGIDTSSSSIPDLSWHPKFCPCQECCNLCVNCNSVFELERCCRYYLRQISKDQVEIKPKFSTSLLAMVSILYVHGYQLLKKSRNSTLISFMFNNSVVKLQPKFEQLTENFKTGISKVHDNHLYSMLPMDVKFLNFVDEQEQLRSTSSSVMSASQNGSRAEHITQNLEHARNQMSIVEYLDFQRLVHQINKGHVTAVNQLYAFWSCLVTAMAGSPYHTKRLTIIASNLVETEARSFVLLNELMLKFSKHPLVYYKAASFIRDVLSDDQMASKLEAVATTLNKEEPESGSVVANSVVDGSVADTSGVFNSTESSINFDDVHSSRDDSDSNLIKKIYRISFYLLTVLLIVLVGVHYFFEHNSLTRAEQFKNFAEFKSVYSYFTGVASEILDDVSPELFSDKLRSVVSKLRTYHRVAFRSLRQRPFWRSSLKLLSNQDFVIEIGPFSSEMSFYDVFLDFSRRSLTILDHSIDQQRLFVEQLISFSESAVVPSFDSVLKSFSLTESNSFYIIFSSVLILTSFGIIFFSIRQVINCFGNLNQNRASALRLFLEIDPNIIIKVADSLHTTSLKLGLKLPKLNSDSFSKTKSTAADRTKLLSGSGVSYSNSLSGLLWKICLVFLILFVIILGCFLLIIVQMHSTKPLFTRFEVVSGFNHQTGRLVTSSDYKRDHSIVTDDIDKLSVDLSGLLLGNIAHSSAFSPCDGSKVSSSKVFDFAPAIREPSLSPFVSSFNCNSFGQCYNSSYYKVDDFGIFYYSKVFLTAFCLNVSRPLIHDLFDPLFLTSHDFSKFLFSNIELSFQSIASFRLTLVIIFFILLMVFRFTIFASAIKTISLDGKRTRRMLKMVPNECKDRDLLKWDDSLKIGVDWIDEQHKKLVFIMNQVYRAAVVDGKSKKILSDALFNLLEYTKTHFADEEKFFDSFNYPGAAAHKSFHRKLEGQVLAFYEKFERGESQVDMNLLTFLKNWLVNHILKSDLHYVESYKHRQDQLNTNSEVDLVLVEDGY